MGLAVFKKKSEVMGPGLMGLDLIFSQKWVCVTCGHTCGCLPALPRELHMCAIDF